ncbi:hypothetical protein D3C86_1279000 [compost metagenome]
MLIATQRWTYIIRNRKVNNDLVILLGKMCFGNDRRSSISSHYNYIIVMNGLTHFCKWNMLDTQFRRKCSRFIFGTVYNSKVVFHTQFLDQVFTGILTYIPHPYHQYFTGTQGRHMPFKKLHCRISYRYGAAAQMSLAANRPGGLQYCIKQTIKKGIGLTFLFGVVKSRF